MEEAATAASFYINKVNPAPNLLGRDFFVLL